MTNYWTTNIAIIDVGLLRSLLTVLRLGFTFSEKPTGFTGDDITVSGGTLSNIAVDAGDEKLYTATFTPTPNTEVTANISIAANSLTDSFGNTNTTGATITIGVDTMPPIAPAVFEQNTNSTTPVISGTATLGTGESLSVLVNGATYDGVTVTAGSWSIDTATATVSSGVLGVFATGNYEVTATVTDAAGNSTSDASSNEIVIDTTASISLSVASTAVDNQINQAESQADVTISGQSSGVGAAGDTIVVALNGQNYTAVVNADGSWTATVPAADANSLENGDYEATITATATASGDTSVVTQSLTVDKIAPTSVFFIDEVITGLPTINGQTEALATVEISIDTDNDGVYDDATYTLVSDASGDWRLDFATATPTTGTTPVFADITTQLGVQVSVADAAGNTTLVTDAGEVQDTSFTISDTKLLEGTTGTKEMVFVVTREGDLSGTGSVDYAVDAGLSSAQSTGTTTDLDYTGANTGTVTFAAGESSKSISFTVNGDYYKEVNQELIVNISNAADGVIAKSTGIGELNEMDMGEMAVAYALRDLDTTYASNAIRVRRSSDDTEMDIGFDKYGQLDTLALLKFVNGNSDGSAVAGQSGYVTTWYDQSGNGKNFGQTDDGKQGTIVSDGLLNTASDGSTAISFGQGLNGANDDYMTLTYANANEEGVTNLEVYMTYEYVNNTSAGLFNVGIGTSGNDRISAHAPWNNGVTYWDASWGTGEGRLQATAQTPNTPQDLVFTANYSNTEAGTAALNDTDARQAFFVDGESKGSDATLVGTSLTFGQTWYLAHYGADSSQRGELSQFMVYKSTANTVSSNSDVLVGSSASNAFTYAGETNITGINGLQGTDYVFLDGATNIDLATLALSGIEVVNAINGSANSVTVSQAQVDANGTALRFLSDAGDSLVYEGTTFNHSASNESGILGTSSNDTVDLSMLNELVHMGAGSDTMVWHSWAQAGTTDIITDMELGAAGDQLDLSDLLTYAASDDLINFINVTDAGAGNDVTITVDKDGSGGFTDLTIVLADIGTGSLSLADLEDNFIVI